MTKFLLSILCLRLSIGSKCQALNVAAKLLENYQQRRKACGAVGQRIAAAPLHVVAAQPPSPCEPRK